MTASKKTTNTVKAAKTPPVIGVCGIRTRARYGDVWDRDLTMLPETYTRALTAAGAVALVAVPGDGLAAHPEVLLDAVDGLLLAGGADIDPTCYGAARHPETGPTDPVRDASEIALTRAAIDRGVPVLGICRGMEILNVALGGDLVQHLPDVLDGDLAHLRRNGEFTTHPVSIAPGTRTAALVGAESTTVRSHHHQAVGRLGAGLRVTGRASDGRVVEAIEHREGYAIGVQWHPEEDPGSRVIAEFVRVVARSGGA